MSLTKESILTILKMIQDPELKRDIVSLGMVREVQIEGQEIHIQLFLPGSALALSQAIRSEIMQKISPAAQGFKIHIDLMAPASAKPAAAMPPRQGIPGIKEVIAVASGKGGVGKTTVAVNLSLALAKLGFKVGLMDGDIYGPNVPLMLGVPNETRPRVNEEERMIPIEALGLKMISMGVLVPADQPMVWRGPMLHSAVTQFLQKVAWGELDYLLIDLPPGTGDVQLSLVQNVPLSGAVIVTTPQEVALMDVRKGIAMFRKTNVPILGIIENMTGEVFGRGGGRKAAEQFQVPYLGEIPLDSAVREGGDQGAPVVLSAENHPASQAFMKAGREVAEILRQTAAVS